MSVPVRAPVAKGVNVTLMVQLAFTASEGPQLLVAPKSPPAANMPPLGNTSGLVVLLVSEMACAELLVATIWPEKVRLVGKKSTEVPVPLRLT
jgi:hypothetical protein